MYRADICGEKSMKPPPLPVEECMVMAGRDVHGTEELSMAEQFSERMLQSIGTSLRHYMPHSKARAIETMQAVIGEVQATAANHAGARIRELEARAANLREGMEWARQRFQVLSVASSHPLASLGLQEVDDRLAIDDNEPAKAEAV